MKVRLYPNEEQQILINKTLGCSRFIYNIMLEERIQVYSELKDEKRELFEYKHKTEKEYKSEFEWLSEVDSDALQQSRLNLTRAYTNFFNSLKGIRKGQRIGFPHFKKKSGHASYKTLNRKGTIRFDISNRKLKIPKLGWVTFRNEKEIFGIIKSAVISKTPTGKYFAFVLFEQELDLDGVEIREDMKIIGLDMSMQNFYVDNLGNSPDYQKPFRSNQKKLAHYQRKLVKKSRVKHFTGEKTKTGKDQYYCTFSKNYEKTRLKVAKVHEKIANSRKDFVHKLSTKLVKENDVIVVENLSLKGMAQGLKLGKSVMDLGYSDFIRQLEYKALWANKTFLRADRWFASSKTCNFCGFKKKDLLLQEREWDCPNCGEHHLRDVNAGINLKNYGMKEIGLKQPEFKSVEIKSSDCQLAMIGNQDLSVKQKARKSLVSG